MRRALLPLALLALAACRGGAPTAGDGAGRPAPPVDPVPPGANVVLVSSEAVPGPEEDVEAYVKVSVDGRDAGQTPALPKSREKRWGAVLAPGNHLFKFEVWSSTAPGSWTPLADAWQPPERFIRVDGAGRAVVTLKLSEGGRRHTLNVSREPASAR